MEPVLQGIKCVQERVEGIRMRSVGRKMQRQMAIAFLMVILQAGAICGMQLLDNPAAPRCIILCAACSFARVTLETGPQIWPAPLNTCHLLYFAGSDCATVSTACSTHAAGLHALRLDAMSIPRYAAS